MNYKGMGSLEIFKDTGSHLWVDIEITWENDQPLSSVQEYLMFVFHPKERHQEVMITFYN